MDTEKRLSDSLRAVMRITGEDQGDLANVLGVTREGINRRINGRGRWTFKELDAIALHWSISPLHLLMGPDEAMAEMLRVRGVKAPVQRTRVSAA